ncbi:diaminopimelate epimerase [Tetragenococcus halophilus]|uniref:diaminopimelate epimerase n=1 Tax=Tetragenococcus halophilus TaxID=51669 RepID=UPI0010320535
MEVPFYKMQGAANDFIVINNMKLRLSDEQLVSLTKQVCRQRFSVGSDALMALDFPQANADFRMKFYNADGTEAEMCGNGVRCIARFAYETGIAKQQMTIETKAGNVDCWRLDKRQYRVQINEPSVENFDLSFPETDFLVDYVKLGNPGVPHVVVHYPQLKEIPLKEMKALAQKMRSWNALDRGANVNFYAIDENDEVTLRTFERGVEDFTLACGTGAVSTAYVLKKKQLVQKDSVTLHVLGGILEVEEKNQHFYLMGDTNIVIKGYIGDEDLIV